LRKLIKKILVGENIFLNLTAKDKPGIIAEMVDGLCAAGMIRDREDALRVILERERKMSTGMKHGVAIPHGKTDTVDHLVVAVGVKKQGVEFECVDGNPARIFIMTISPAKQTGPHIQFLAEVSRILRQKDLRDRMLTARTPEEVISIFT
jgi:fructose-specific phosphotransferase system IIA component